LGADITDLHSFTATTTRSAVELMCWAVFLYPERMSSILNEASWISRDL